jgi:hypothetical protein
MAKEIKGTSGTTYIIEDDGEASDRDVQRVMREIERRRVQERMDKFGEAELARVGGPVRWGITNAEIAEDQMQDYGGVENAYDAYYNNVEDTLNEWGFDLSTDRGEEVIKAARDAFEEKYLELTGYDFWSSV